VDRRTFISGVTASLARPVIRANAQQAGRVWRVAYLIAEPTPGLDRPFDGAMKALGYVEGKNLVTERRYLGPRREVPDEMVQEVVRLNRSPSATRRICRVSLTLSAGLGYRC